MIPDSLAPEHIVSKMMSAGLAVALGLLGFFFQRTLRKIDHDNEEQRKALDSLAGKIDRFTDRVSDQVQQVQREVSSLRVEFAREVATLRTELGAVRSRQDSLERDLNNAMRWVRTEFEGVHAELSVNPGGDKP